MAGTSGMYMEHLRSPHIEDPVNHRYHSPKIQKFEQMHIMGCSNVNIAMNIKLLGMAS